ncbi:hypothetical protein BN1708_012140, partial [Verticillium longisporum]
RQPPLFDHHRLSTPFEIGRLIMRVLCVAEKPSISKAVTDHLSGGQSQTRNTNDRFTKNYCFSFNFGPPWNQCDVTMTAVRGHLLGMEFTPANKNWQYPPPDSLFHAPIVTTVASDKKAVADNIEQQARYCDLLIVWTDCDREGENIGREIVGLAKKGKPTIRVKRAKFSNIERTHVIQAAKNLVDLDERQADAVDARMELDLRIGYAFTRFLTTNLRALGGPLVEMIISYGSCQFPTLGFVVDRYFRVKNFVPEQFWSIHVNHTQEGKKVKFAWSRNRLFDRMAVTILYERCILARTAKVTKVQEKPTRKWKPLPLTTVELQKAATRLLRMSGQQAMSVAEDLYNKGFISYPRTETDRFDKEINLRNLVQKQTQSDAWGQYAQDLLSGSFSQPRQGRHDDKAHPPIHPVTFASPSVLTHDAKRLYEYIKIQDREYAALIDQTGPAAQDDDDDEVESPPARGGARGGRGSRGGRGRGGRGGRGGASSSGGRGRLKVFVPTKLGMALIVGFDRMELETSLGKPFLRKEMEAQMKAICEGRASKAEVLQQNIGQYRQVFALTQEKMNTLKEACREFIFA